MRGGCTCTCLHSARGDGADAHVAGRNEVVSCGCRQRVHRKFGGAIHAAPCTSRHPCSCCRALRRLQAAASNRQQQGTHGYKYAHLRAPEPDRVDTQFAERLCYVLRPLNCRLWPKRVPGHGADVSPTPLSLVCSQSQPDMTPLPASSTSLQCELFKSLVQIRWQKARKTLVCPHLSTAAC